jgi:hypothetical protein
MSTLSIPYALERIAPLALSGLAARPGVVGVRRQQRRLRG